MFLTPRETLILKELLHSASPVTVERLMSLLKVSKRTVYRELANLELSLESIGAKLEKESRGRFRLLAEDAAKAKSERDFYKRESERLKMEDSDKKPGSGLWGN